jgi:hypothetical protein
MKALIAVVWQRRWCSFLAIVFALCTLPLLQPFVRQSIFGPTINGIPWCVWENEIRAASSGVTEPSWFQRMMEKVGLFKREAHVLNLDSNAAMPVFRHLSDDGNVKVRRYALSMLSSNGEDKHENLLIMRRHIQDDDPSCRLSAAHLIWQVEKDRAMIGLALALKDEPDLTVRRNACYLLNDMAEFDAALFEPMSKMVNDPDHVVRGTAINAMQHFGKRGVPILRVAMRDPIVYVRHRAIGAATQLGKDGAALFPDLLQLKTDADPYICRNAAHSLYIMDPKQFDKPATWGTDVNSPLP